MIGGGRRAGATGAATRSVVAVRAAARRTLATGAKAAPSIIRLSATWCARIA
jgi:hypothetical protein